MKTHIRRGVVLVALTLTACFGGSEKAPSMISMAARKGMQWSYELLINGVVAPEPAIRPSAMLGPYLAAFLSLPTVETSHAAVSGVLAGASILFDDDLTPDESYALLEELGLTLQVDLPDYLDRSVDRQDALDLYRTGLVDVATRSQEHLAFLEQRQDDASALVREVRSQSSQIQRGLNDALRAKDYATASTRQAQLSDIQGELAIANAEQKEIRSIIGLFEDSLQIAANRLAAIDVNREALIAGVSVTDIPGATDLGVLEESTRRRRNADPEDVFGPTQ